ncbi:MAG: hypothetical protein IT370_30010 [Deltaproteobacteria bacterium]|nr:hypothetical protein [Deltaproteobacteria bacterium]
MAGPDTLRCPGCGEVLAATDARGRCPKCQLDPTGVQLGVLVLGKGFTMPKLCSCCLARTERTSTQTSGGRMTYQVSLALPKCSSCSAVSALTSMVRFLGWTLGLLAALLAANRFTAPRTAQYSVVLFGGWAALVVTGYLITRWLPPFRRRGHTLRCRAVRLHFDSVSCHNQHFAKILRESAAKN